MVGVDLRPRETITQTLLPGQRVIFYWSVIPRTTGRLSGTVWFYIRFIPKNGGNESRLAISAQPVEIEVSSIFGLRTVSIRWLSIGGIVLGIILIWPFLYD